QHQPGRDAAGLRLCPTAALMRGASADWIAEWRLRRMRSVCRLRGERAMKTIRATAFLIAMALGLALPAAGQASSTSAGERHADNEAKSDDKVKEAQPPSKGFNEYENFRGMVNSFGSLLKLDSTLGYDFNQHIGVFAGIPLYFASDVHATPGQTMVHSAG